MVPLSTPGVKNRNSFPRPEEKYVHQRVLCGHYSERRLNCPAAEQRFVIKAMTHSLKNVAKKIRFWIAPGVSTFR